MLTAWSTIKWAVVASVVLYFGLYLVARRRLQGERRKHNERLLSVVLVAVVLSSCIDLVFESVHASRIAATGVGLIGAVATVILIRMLTDREHTDVAGRTERE